MTTAIWKYPLPDPGSARIINMPGPVRPVHVGPDPRGIPSLWAEVTLGADRVQASLAVWATGQPIEVAEDPDTFTRWHTAS